MIDMKLLLKLASLGLVVAFAIVLLPVPQVHAICLASLIDTTVNRLPLQRLDTTDSFKGSSVLGVGQECGGTVLIANPGKVCRPIGGELGIPEGSIFESVSSVFAFDMSGPATITYAEWPEYWTESGNSTDHRVTIDYVNEVFEWPDAARSTTQIQSSVSCRGGECTAGPALLYGGWSLSPPNDSRRPDYESPSHQDATKAAYAVGVEPEGGVDGGVTEGGPEDHLAGPPCPHFHPADSSVQGGCGSFAMASVSAQAQSAFLKTPNHNTPERIQSVTIQATELERWICGSESEGMVRGEPICVESTSQRVARFFGNIGDPGCILKGSCAFNVKVLVFIDAFLGRKQQSPDAQDGSPYQYWAYITRGTSPPDPEDTFYKYNMPDGPVSSDWPQMNEKYVGTKCRVAVGGGGSVDAVCMWPDYLYVTWHWNKAFSPPINSDIASSDYQTYRDGVMRELGEM